MNLYRTAAVVTFFNAAEHCLGFLYRIILSRTLGAEGLGVYQAAYSMFAVFLTVSASGLPVTLSRTISKHRARGNRLGEQAATSAAVSVSLCFSVPMTVLLFLFRDPFSGVFADPRCADVFYILLAGLSLTSVYAVLRGCFWGNKRFFAYSFVELAEEMLRIGAGIALLLLLPAANGITLTAVAVLISYLFSFLLAAVYFFARGGKLRSPRGELRPMLLSSLPVTAMRTSSSLLSSLISLLFPLMLRAAGYTASAAMREYGVVYGMVMPVMAVPCAFIGSIALVLVPELAEQYYRGNRKEVTALIGRALRATLLIAGALLPFYLVCGGDVGILLYSDAQSGALISLCAPLLVPMSLTMITTSLLNSLGCEKKTLAVFLCGSAGMLACVLTLPRFLGSGALAVGMLCDNLICALLSLMLLRKRAGALHMGKFLLRLCCAVLPAALAGFAVRKGLFLVLGFLPALALTMFFLLLAEGALFAVLRLVGFRGFFTRFLRKKSKKSLANS